MRILFVHNHSARFVRLDIGLLAERYRVSERLEVRPSGLRLVELWRQVRQHDLVFCWFASWHAFAPLLFARMLRKHSILLIGGYDVASMPEIHYGHQRGGLRKWIAQGAMRLATRLVTHSHYSRDEAMRNVGLASEEISVIHLGLDHRAYGFSESKQPMAVTVGYVNVENLRRKGMESFVQAAQYLQGVPLVLLGSWLDGAAERLRRAAPPNVTLTGYVSDEQLADYLRQAKIYVQASAHESFGLAVAEAMLCGCIPVTSRAGALPEVVGDTGIYLPSTEPAAIADGIRTGLTMDSESGLRARERIIREFPLEKRRRQLFELIEGLPRIRV